MIKCQKRESSLCFGNFEWRLGEQAAAMRRRLFSSHLTAISRVNSAHINDYHPRLCLPCRGALRRAFHRTFDRLYHWSVLLLRS